MDVNEALRVVAAEHPEAGFTRRDPYIDVFWTDTHGCLRRLGEVRHNRWAQAWERRYAFSLDWGGRYPSVRAAIEDVLAHRDQVPYLCQNCGTSKGPATGYAGWQWVSDYRVDRLCPSCFASYDWSEFWTFDPGDGIWHHNPDPAPDDRDAPAGTGRPDPEEGS